MVHRASANPRKLRIPRKPISEYARMPITDYAHADHPRSEATLSRYVVTD
jgi:hypothetical protein